MNFHNLTLCKSPEAPDSITDKYVLQPEEWNNVKASDQYWESKRFDSRLFKIIFTLYFCIILGVEMERLFWNESKYELRYGRGPFQDISPVIASRKRGKQNFTYYKRCWKWVVSFMPRQFYSWEKVPTMRRIGGWLDRRRDMDSLKNKFLVLARNRFNKTVTLLLELVRNLVAHGDPREGKWRGNWRMEWVASNLTPPPNVVYPPFFKLMRTPRLPVVDWTDAPHRFKWTRPFRGKTKSGFCACSITFRTSYTQVTLLSQIVIRKKRGWGWEEE